MTLPEPVGIYHGRNPLELPLFSRADAARWLGVSYSTLRRWAKDEPKDGINFIKLLEYFERRSIGKAGHWRFTVEGEPKVFYPATSPAMSVTINPLVRFGRPTATDTGITTSILAHRVSAGETPEEIADDYGIDVVLVKAAVEFEAR